MRSSPSPVAGASTQPGGIGGNVVDERGNPVPGATLSISWWPLTHPLDLDGYQKTTYYDVTTDAHGRWNDTRIPDGDLSALHLNIHLDKSGYAPARVDPLPPELRQNKAKLIIPDGQDVRGQVIDAQGNPVGAVQVRISSNWESTATTDPNGHFTLHHIPIGEPSQITATAPGIGSAAANVSVTKDVGDVSVPLVPFIKLNGHIFDQDGYPVQGAEVTAMSGAQKIKTLTDARGNYHLDDVPPVSMSVQVVKDHYGRIYQDVALGQTTLNIRLHEIIDLSGRVEDTATHTLLAGATVRLGQPAQEVEPEHFYEAKALPKGTFHLPADLSQGPIVLCAQADGYEPAVAGPYAADSANIVISMKSAKGRPVHVFNYDQAPAVGAKVGYVSTGEPIDFDLYLATQGVTDSTGLYTLPAQRTAVALLVTNATGYALAQLDPSTEDVDIHLHAWASLAIHIPDQCLPSKAERTLYISSPRDLETGGNAAFAAVLPYSADGSYALARVPAFDPATLSVRAGRDIASHLTTAISLISNQQTQVTLAAAPSVTGRLAIPASATGLGRRYIVSLMPAFGPPAQWPTDWTTSLQSKRDFYEVDNDITGAFTFPSVASGEYNLIPHYIYNRPPTVNHNLTVSGSVNVGSVDVTQTPNDPGCPAPAALARNMDGSLLQTSTLRGKYVLVTYYQQPGNLDRIPAIFKNNPNITLLAVHCVYIYPVIPHRPTQLTDPRWLQAVAVGPDANLLEGWAHDVREPQNASTALIDPHGNIIDTSLTIDSAIRRLRTSMAASGISN